MEEQGQWLIFYNPVSSVCGKNVRKYICIDQIMVPGEPSHCVTLQELRTIIRVYIYCWTKHESYRDTIFACLHFPLAVKLAWNQVSPIIWQATTILTHRLDKNGLLSREGEVSFIAFIYYTSALSVPCFPITFQCMYSYAYTWLSL